MANNVETEKWIKYFSKDNNIAIATNSIRNSTKTVVVSEIRKCLKDKIQKNKLKGFSSVLRVCVVGVPNTGKSTLINTLANATLSKTGNIAGVTRTAVWRKVENGIELMDNAGTLWPKLEDDNISLNLAFIGSISDNVLDTTELAFSLIEKLKIIDPKDLKERYQLDSLDKETLEIIENICKTRGFIFKKNEFDYERCGKAIIDDFRKCRIGKITLDICKKEL